MTGSDTVSASANGVVVFRDVSFRYGEDAPPVLSQCTFAIQEGEFCLVMGATGGGKSTLLSAMCGLVPHFTGGVLAGEVIVEGRSTRDHPPRELADVVGYVGQDPTAGFVTDRVADEIAYVMENLGVAPATMERRVEDTLDLLDLARLRDRPLRTLSGGQRQRVAIGSVLAAAPRILVLDEPTSALDPASADEVLAALSRLVHEVGLTVVLAEHRLERVLHLADTALVLDGVGGVRGGPIAEVMAGDGPAPPLVQLARRAGWQPVPLSVREGRRRCEPWRTAGLQVGAPSDEAASIAGASIAGASIAGASDGALSGGALSGAAASVGAAEGVTVVHGRVRALDGCSIELGAGEVVAVMGRNGAGKSTLLAALAGVLPPVGSAGRVRVGGHDPARLPATQRIRRVGLVPQDPGLLLTASTVGQECIESDRDAGLPAGTTRSLLDRILGSVPTDTHPRDLSEGQRLAVALAVVLAPAPDLVLLDEPTRGLDYAAKGRLGRVLAELAADGVAVAVATHDVELAAEFTDRVVLLAEGRVVDSGPTREVVCRSPVFAPQIARVMAPVPLLTVDELLAAVEGAGAVHTGIEGAETGLPPRERDR